MLLLMVVVQYGVSCVLVVCKLEVISLIVFVRVLMPSSCYLLSNCLLLTKLVVVHILLPSGYSY